MTDATNFPGGPGEQRPRSSLQALSTQRWRAARNRLRAGAALARGELCGRPRAAWPRPRRAVWATGSIFRMALSPGLVCKLQQASGRRPRAPTGYATGPHRLEKVPGGLRKPPRTPRPGKAQIRLNFNKELLRILYCSRRPPEASRGAIPCGAVAHAARFATGSSSRASAERDSVRDCRPN